MGWDASGYVNEDGMLCTATTFNGVVFDQCRINIKNSWTKQYDDTQLCESTIYWRVPVGFDGYVLSFRDSGVAWEDGQHIYDIADENTLLFRVGAIVPERPIAEATDAQLKRCIDTGDWGGGTETDAWGKEVGEECSVKLSYTHVIEELELAAYDIVGTEVLSATLNGVPCTIYQTHDPDRIMQIVASEGPGDYEDYVDRLHTVFLVESPEITAIADGNGGIVANYRYIVRVYLSDGSYRDLEYGGDDYYLRGGFGGMITYPETYE